MKKLRIKSSHQGSTIRRQSVMLNHCHALSHIELRLKLVAKYSLRRWHSRVAMAFRLSLTMQPGLMGNDIEMTSPEIYLQVCKSRKVSLLHEMRNNIAWLNLQEWRNFNSIHKAFSNIYLVQNREKPISPQIKQHLVL